MSAITIVATMWAPAVVSGAGGRRSSVSFGMVRRRGMEMRMKCGATAYKVKIVGPNGEESEFDAPDDRYILESAEEAGQELPYSCRAGACSTCAGKIVSGSVNQTDGSYLDESQMEKGYLLTCVSYPTSNLVIHTHKEAELY